MTELTDLEICKRIAEIEGHDVSVEEYGVFISSFNDNYNCHESNEYNPLTDDALCFQLMVKYHIELSPLFDGEWCASNINKYEYEGDPILENQGLDFNPNKAILLAIIEANKES